jgi:hypothetical protein
MSRHAISTALFCRFFFFLLVSQALKKNIILHSAGACSQQAYMFQHVGRDAVAFATMNAAAWQPAPSGA